jgi:hypothetical protein
MSGCGGVFEAFFHPSPGKGTEVVCKTASRFEVGGKWVGVVCVWV